MTLYNIGISDGAWRRGIFGTVMTPLWSLTDHRYGVMALVALGILALLLAIALLATWRARWDAQRLLIAAWFVSPAGAYVFHEVGYLDQFVYVLFFIAVGLLLRVSFAAAIAVMTLSVLVHEVTLFTTLPLLLLIAIVRGLRIQLLAWFALPVLAGALLFFAPLMSEEQVGATGARLQGVLPFEIRWDAVALFGRSLGETWAMEFYSPWRGFFLVLPLLIATVGAMTLVVVWLARNVDLTSHTLVLARVVAVISAGLPFFLVFLGWDFHRWAFLGLANFLIAVYVWFAHVDRQISLGAIGITLVPRAVLFFVPLEYFDGYQPRSLSPEMFERIMYSPHTEFLGFPKDRL